MTPEQKKEYMREYHVQYYKKNKEKIDLKNKEWNLKNKERKKELHKKYNSLYKKEKRNSALRKKYGISLEEYNILEVSQNGCCKICGTHKEKLSTSLAVDHNHNTGKIRGLLCNNCNRGLGYLKDSKDILEKALDYLKIESVEEEVK